MRVVECDGGGWRVEGDSGLVWVVEGDGCGSGGVEGWRGEG